MGNYALERLSHGRAGKSSVVLLLAGEAKPSPHKPANCALWALLFAFVGGARHAVIFALATKNKQHKRTKKQIKTTVAAEQRMALQQEATRTHAHAAIEALPRGKGG